MYGMVEKLKLCSVMSAALWCKVMDGWLLLGLQKRKRNNNTTPRRPPITQPSSRRQPQKSAPISIPTQCCFISLDWICIHLIQETYRAKQWVNASNEIRKDNRQLVRRIHQWSCESSGGKCTENSYTQSAQNSQEILNSWMNSRFIHMICKIFRIFFHYLKPIVSSDSQLNLFSTAR